MTSLSRFQLFLLGLSGALTLGLSIYFISNQFNPNPCRFRALGSLVMPLLTGVGGIFISTYSLQKQNGKVTFGLGIFAASIPLLALALLVLAQLRASECGQNVPLTPQTNTR